jgi:hypothetical protein
MLKLGKFPYQVNELYKLTNSELNEMHESLMENITKGENIHCYSICSVYCLFLQGKYNEAMYVIETFVKPNSESDAKTLKFHIACSKRGL